MPEPKSSFADLIAPVSAEAFFRDYHHRKWLHVEASPERASGLLPQDELDRLLAMKIWSQHSLQLVLDRQRVPPAAYCAPGVDRNRNQSLQPDPGRVQALLDRGASMVLNDIDGVCPGIGQVAEGIEEAVGDAKAAANLYYSVAERQAFDSHFDRHDVYVLQIHGEKRWNVYQGRADNPIEHPAFHNVPQAEYDRMKGPVAERLTMRPGDFLYLPRGQFHDALASSEVSIHVTFSCGEPTGLGWLTSLWNRAVHDTSFRADLPREAEGDEALRAHLTRLLSRLQEMTEGPEGLDHAKAMRRGFRTRRDTVTLRRLK